MTYWIYPVGWAPGPGGSFDSRRGCADGQLSGLADSYHATTISYYLSLWLPPLLFSIMFIIICSSSSSSSSSSSIVVWISWLLRLLVSLSLWLSLLSLLSSLLSISSQLLYRCWHHYSAEGQLSDLVDGPAGASARLPGSWAWEAYSSNTYVHSICVA